MSEKPLLLLHHLAVMSVSVTDRSVCVGVCLCLCTVSALGSVGGAAAAVGVAAGAAGGVASCRSAVTEREGSRLMAATQFMTQLVQSARSRQ